MPRKHSDYEMVTRICRSLREKQTRMAYPDAVLMESMDRFVKEFRFLFIFLSYTRAWSDAHKVVPNLDQLVPRIAAAIKECRKNLHYAFAENYRGEYYLFYESTCGWKDCWRGVGDCLRMDYCPREPCSLLDVFASLNEQTEMLKQEIRNAYYEHLSSHAFHCQPASSWTGDYSWYDFCSSIRWSLQLLSEKLDLVVDTLRKQMKALNWSLYSLKSFIQHQCNDGYHGKVHMIARFGQVAVRTAHVCCLCWSVGEMDLNMEKDVASLLSDLQQKIDLASPEFLGLILEFLEVEECRVTFLDRMLDVKKVSGLHDDLLPLIDCVVKIPKMDNMDVQKFSISIKAVIVEISNLKHKCNTMSIIDIVSLFARVWILKAEIFLTEQQIAVTLLALSLEDYITALQKGLSLLLKSFTQTRKKTEEQIFALVDDMPRQIEALYRSSSAEEFIGNKVRDALYKFLVNAMLFKAKALVLKLLDSDASLIVPMKRQIGTLHEALVFVIESTLSQPKENEENEKQILTYIEAVAARVISLCNSFSADQTTEEAVTKMVFWLSDSLEIIQLLTPKFKELYLQIPRLHFPKTPQLGFVEFLLQKLRQLLRQKLDSVQHVIHQIESIHEDLEILMSFFRHSLKQGIGNQEHEDLRTHLIVLAYEAECVINSIVIGGSAEWNHLPWLYHVSQEIRHMKMQVIDLHEKESRGIGNCIAPQTLWPSLPQASITNIDEEVVVLNDQQQVLIDKLTRGLSQRDVVSIVGMPGIGKTTLAFKVYNDPEVVCYFHIRAWCRVSQAYSRRSLLLDILRHIIELNDTILAMSNEDLDLVLYKHLKKNRYLIFMDDMWSIRAWDDFKISFPDDGNGSRILMTSRLCDAVSKVTPECNLLNLRLLSDDESWELLKLKIFHQESYPEELFEVGKEIARNCKGLPLSVVAIAGILNRTSKEYESWKQIAESLDSLIVGDQQTRCMDILELSYKNLPDDLKACFLYFAALEEDKEISVSKLIRLWMAEGFVQKEASNSLEGLAKDYLMDLIGRSLIIVTKRRSMGGVKACRFHDIVRCLCLLKSKEENFLELVTSKDEPYASFDGSMDFDDFDPSDSMTYEKYRLCVHSSRKHFFMSRPSGPYVRSLLFYATTDTYPRCPYDTLFISKNFKLLKVLDLECVNMGTSFANGIELLVQLHYLAVGGDIDSIPSSLANLQNLETFLVKGLKGKVTIPDSIWTMTSLRHLHVVNHATFALQDGKIGSSCELSNLVSLSSPSLSYREHAEEILRGLPNLQKLSCIFSKSWDNSKKCNQFPRLEDMTHLESLKISYIGRSVSSGEFSFPLSLKKLTLSTFFLRWDHISTIGCLENLEVLKLLSITFESTQWEMQDGEFPELKFLKLHNSNIVDWSASCDHLPNLQQLVLQKCDNLREVPIDFVDITTLQVIEVQRCGDSVEESVRRLKEEELMRYGTEHLKVLIHH